MSELEETFAGQLRILALASELPAPVRELAFAPPRRWRFDFAWPELSLAVELEGGIWSGGRHARGRGIADDAEKYNAAALRGWTVLRYTSDDVGTWVAARAVSAILGERRAAVR